MLSRIFGTAWRDRGRHFLTEYGKVGACTHVVLSGMFYSGIYTGIYFGVDVEKWLSSLGIHAGKAGAQGSTAVVAYTVYKIISPLRWPVTFAVTPFVARRLYTQVPKK